MVLLGKGCHLQPRCRWRFPDGHAICAPGQRETFMKTVARVPDELERLRKELDELEALTAPLNAPTDVRAMRMAVAKFVQLQTDIKTLEEREAQVERS